MVLVGWLEQKFKLGGLKYVETDLVQNISETWELEGIEKWAILILFCLDTGKKYGVSSKNLFLATKETN